MKSSLKALRNRAKRALVATTIKTSGIPNPDDFLPVPPELKHAVKKIKKPLPDSKKSAAADSDVTHTPEVQSLPVHKTPEELKREARVAGVKKNKADRRKIAKQRLTEGDRTIFVGNLPCTAKKSDLLKSFGAAGKIVSMRFRSVLPPSDKISRAVAYKRGAFSEEVRSCNAYILFETTDMAKAAVQSCNNSLVKGRHVTVTLANQKQGCSKNSVFVGNLPKDTDEEDLRKHFAEFGEVGSVRLVRDSYTGEVKGFGFVEFLSKDGLCLCLAAKNNVFQNRELRCTKAAKKPKAKSGTSNDHHSSRGGGQKKQRNGPPNNSSVKSNKKGTYMERQQKKKQSFKAMKKRTYTSSQI